MSQLADITNKYFNKYTVEDVINPEAIILFILESPHTQEMKNGYPVAGGSGVEMTKFIYGKKYKDAFGKIVSQKEKYQDKYNNLDKFSILNVSPAPMQEGGLKDYNLSKEDKQVVSILEKLRVNYKSKRHRNKKWNRVKSLLLDNFKHRLVSLVSQNSKIRYVVPCGRFASSYLNLVKHDIEDIKNEEIIFNIPHPSFNQWSHYESMNELEQILSFV